VHDDSSIVILQTAFPGDVVLTLPLVQGLKRRFPKSSVSMVVIPKAAEVLQNHPDIAEVIVYDKRRSDAGLAGFLRLVKKLRSRHFATAIIPHRSLRSAALAAVAGITRRIGFNTSAGRFLLTDVVQYEQSTHEVARNLSLTRPLVEEPIEKENARLFPSLADRNVVDGKMAGEWRDPVAPMMGIAPCSEWNTKRWPEERFRDLIRMIVRAGNRVVLIGGSADVALCERLRKDTDQSSVLSLAGMLTFLQSAEAIRRCAVLVSNDSAPMHLAVAMQTPVVAIFGPTIPGFGFAPTGRHDRMVEVAGLPCRPCSIHGGAKCPIDTFDCMIKIDTLEVFKEITNVLESRKSVTL